MKKQLVILKLFIYYIIGFISFSIIAHITHITLVAILTESMIMPLQEIYHMPKTLIYLSPWYISVYTFLYFSMLYIINKYDRHIVNRLNEDLEKLKGGNENGER